MKWYMSAGLITLLGLGLIFGLAGFHDPLQAAPAGEMITVLNPLGTPPPITLQPMAPRLNTLDGKTIYIVDDGYVGGDRLLKQIVTWFEKNYPKTTAIYKRKGGGGFEAEDPQLWAEIKEKADAVIIGMGH
jgi:hypothetical protein